MSPTTDTSLRCHPEINSPDPFSSSMIMRLGYVWPNDLTYQGVRYRFIPYGAIWPEALYAPMYPDTMQVFRWVKLPLGQEWLQRRKRITSGIIKLNLQPEQVNLMAVVTLFRHERMVGRYKRYQWSWDAKLGWPMNGQLSSEYQSINETVRLDTPLGVIVHSNVFIPVEIAGNWFPAFQNFRYL